ncbi:unnamed protein product [Linum trigynum]|uniref:Cytochrome b5 heme-binding domain-containing protein n=1 Tax=Linum trigynum TaxID=586398 RepID=A0AAV2E4F9_9ROSI
MAVEKKYITSEDLKKYKKPGDLWITIQGKVYDVSEWVKRHPGGEVAIANVAGQDVTDAFIAYHPGTAWKNLDPLFTGYHLEDYAISDVSKDYRRLAAEFSKLGLFDKKGHVAFSALAVVAALFSLVVYGVSPSSSPATASRGSASRDGSGRTTPTIWRNLDFDPVARFLVSYQHWTFYPVMCVARVNLYLQTFILLFSPKRIVPDRALNIVGILVFWPRFPLLVARLPNWPERFVFVLTSFAVTSIQHVQFCLNHFPANMYMGPPRANDCCSYLANPVPKNMVWEAVHTHG